MRGVQGEIREGMRVIRGGNVSEYEFTSTDKLGLKMRVYQFTPLLCAMDGKTDVVKLGGPPVLSKPLIGTIDVSLSKVAPKVLYNVNHKDQDCNLL